MYELIMNQDWASLHIRVVLWAGIIFLAWTAVVVACLCDMWAGVEAARAIGEKIHSHRLRETITKVKDYASVLLCFFFIDIIGSLFSFYFAPFVQIVIATGAVCIEAKSVFENRKRKKSNAGMIPEIALQIVRCAREKDAEAIIYNITNTVKEDAAAGKDAAAKPTTTKRRTARKAKE